MLPGRTTSHSSSCMIATPAGRAAARRVEGCAPPETLAALQAVAPGDLALSANTKRTSANEGSSSIDLHDFIFSSEREVVPWHRIAEFQLVSLARIAEQLSARQPSICGPVLPLVLDGGVAWARMRFAWERVGVCEPKQPGGGPSAARDAGAPLGAAASRHARPCDLRACRPPDQSS